MPRIYDVTVPLSKDVPTFPGDPRFEMDFAHRIEDGKPCNVAYLKLGAHAGTHVDAPFHFLREGRTVEQLPLDVLIGAARVVEVASRDVIGRADVDSADLAGATRVLFKTRNSGTLRRPEFREDFVALAPGAAERLVERGITLVGVDYLSVEKFGSVDFAAHHALLGAIVRSFEGIPPGRFAVDDRLAASLAGFGAGVIEASIRLSAPVFAALVLLSVMIGLMSKVAPQWHILDTSYSIRTGGGLLLVFAAFCVQSLGDHLHELFASPVAAATMGLIVLVAILLCVLVRIGEIRWRAQGLDLDGTRPPDDEIEDVRP